MIHGSKVLFGIGGGVAALKAADAARLLMEQGAQIQVVMSNAAAHFVTPFSLENLTGRPVYADLWSQSPSGEAHILHARWADVMVIAPATMELIGKLAMGLPDDALTCTAVACPAPLILAPAMNSVMWEHPATQHNLAILRDRGATIVGPTVGRLASGAEGIGRMAEAVDVADATAVALGRQGDMAGLRLVVTAGPTYEPIDPVRFVGNRSSGKMGYALAVAARDRGAVVTLISGPVSLATPYGVNIIHVGTAAEMHDAVRGAVVGADALIMAAAVADYRPSEVSKQKIKKGHASISLELQRNPDILESLSSAAIAKVGFAAETMNVVASGRQKLEDKRLDLLVANDVAGGAVFGSDYSRVHLIDRTGQITDIGPALKTEIAEHVLDALVLALRRAQNSAAGCAPSSMSLHEN